MNEQEISRIIGANIKRKREEGCLSLSTIAQETGLSERLLQRLEHGEDAPAAALYLLCQFYQCSAQDFWQNLSPTTQDNSEQTQNLAQNFVNTDQPNRGQLFGDYLQDITNQND